MSAAPRYADLPLFQAAPEPPRRKRAPYGGRPPSAPGSETSARAALRIAHKAPTQRMRVLEFLTRRGPLGATRHEIAAALGFTLQSACGRVGELLGRKEIEATTHRREGREVLVACQVAGGEMREGWL